MGLFFHLLVIAYEAQQQVQVCVGAYVACQSKVLRNHIYSTFMYNWRLDTFNSADQTGVLTHH